MHIQKNSMDIFSHNQNMDTDEMLSFLEHLDHCNFCLEQMLEEENRNLHEAAPAYLREEILKRAASPDIQASKIITSASRRIQFLTYGIRTAVGVAAALTLLFCIGRMELTSFDSFSVAQTTAFSSEPRPTDPITGLCHFSNAVGSEISRGSDKLADYLGSFSNKILRGGD